MASDQRPNILFIMTDQQRGDCLSLAGHPVLDTPNMDTIGAHGAFFRRAYTTCPSCIAARRSLMSGMHPASHGMVGYRDGVEWHPPATLPQTLRDAGYQTWLVGRSMHQHPPRKRYGFDHMLFHSGTEGDYASVLQREVPESGGWHGGGVMHNDWTARPFHLPEHLHHSNWTTNQALQFLDHYRDPSCPFFLVVSYLSPHPPLQPPACYMQRYLDQDLPGPRLGDWWEPPANRGIGMDVSSGHVDLQGERLRYAQAGYYGLIHHIDDQIRRLINPIDGIHRRTDANTIVVFTSDHGEMLGDHHHFRKQVPFEGSANIPMLLQAPQRFGIKPGTLVDQPVCLEDLMPTLLDLADVDIPGSVEGRSLLPLLRGENVGWRDYLHIEHAPGHQAVTDGREKFVWLVNSGRELFFDLTNDPRELKNLADDASHKARVDLWRSRLIDKLQDRPEGFVQNGQLVAGRRYDALLER